MVNKQTKKNNIKEGTAPDFSFTLLLPTMGRYPLEFHRSSLHLCNFSLHKHECPFMPAVLFFSIEKIISMKYFGFEGHITEKGNHQAIND